MLAARATGINNVAPTQADCLNLPEPTETAFSVLHNSQLHNQTVPAAAADSLSEARGVTVMPQPGALASTAWPPGNGSVARTPDVR